MDIDMLKDWLTPRERDDFFQEAEHEIDALDDPRRKVRLSAILSRLTSLDHICRSTPQQEVYEADDLYEGIPKSGRNKDIGVLNKAFQQAVTFYFSENPTHRKRKSSTPRELHQDFSAEINRIIEESKTSYNQTGVATLRKGVVNLLGETLQNLRHYRGKITKETLEKTLQETWAFEIYDNNATRTQAREALNQALDKVNRIENGWWEHRVVERNTPSDLG